MDSYDRSTIDPWFLSGEPVVRLWGRDFDVSVQHYRDWLLELARNYDVEIQLKSLVDPPGIIVRAYLGEEPFKLKDPLLIVNKSKMRWLFCTVKDCQNRLADQMPPGGVCEKHRGTH